MIKTNYQGASEDLVQKDVTPQLVFAILGNKNLSYIKATSMWYQS